MRLGINASRARSGGARAHLVGLLDAADPAAHGIAEVHVWSYRALLEALPDRPWLVRHNPPALERSLPAQLGWERFALPGAFARTGCDVLLNVDAGTMATVRPAVTMSRDMLSFEPGATERYGLTAWRARLVALRYAQVRALRTAQGAIFLTRYAAQVIQRFSGRLERVAIIPHGVSETFRLNGPARAWPATGERPIECLYVSPVWRFKHHVEVVSAVAELRRRGHDLVLTLAGGGEADTLANLEQRIDAVDPERRFVRLLGQIDHGALPGVIAAADLYIFASSCENMPNTLLEGMAAGLPIACSDRGPMPEVIADGAALFDPQDTGSIVAAIARIVEDAPFRRAVAARALALSRAYSWDRCARDTLTFVAATAREHG